MKTLMLLVALAAIIYATLPNTNRIERECFDRALYQFRSQHNDDLDPFGALMGDIDYLHGDDEVKKALWGFMGPVQYACMQAQCVNNNGIDYSCLLGLPKDRP